MLPLNSSNCLQPTSPFSTRPIGTLSTLARMLQMPVQELEQVAAGADTLYYVAATKLKSDGSIRVCHDVMPPLKSIHGRIQSMILKQVQYPLYLQGGIKDKVSPRGQAANAQAHLRPKSLITLDIKKFFPNVDRSLVYGVWHGFFRFPPPVANCLTALTTLDGCLPQGAKTSPLLANLVFWDLEWKLVAEMMEMDVLYTRLIDDISISSGQRLSPERLSRCIEKVHGMCLKTRLELNRRKQTLSNGGSPMMVTKLLVNERVAIPHAVRSQIKSHAFSVIQTPPWERRTFDFRRKHQKALGQISYLKQHHPAMADAIRLEVEETQPIDE